MSYLKDLITWLKDQLRDKPNQPVLFLTLEPAVPEGMMAVWDEKSRYERHLDKTLLNGGFSLELGISFYEIKTSAGSEICLQTKDGSSAIWLSEEEFVEKLKEAYSLKIVDLRN